MAIIKGEIEDIDKVCFELIEKGLLKKSIDGGYINNKKLYHVMCEYHDKKMKNIEMGLPIPPLPQEAGYAIIQIATRRCNSHMYRTYTNAWKEEMIGNAILTGAMRCHNFDPEKTDNPFAYFTSVCDNAIKEQIKKEKKQLYIKYKMMDEHRGFLAELDQQENDIDFVELDYVNASEESRSFFINLYEERLKEKKINGRINKDEDFITLQF